VNMRQKLRIENPAIAAEWDNEKNKGLNIDDCTGGSNKYVWWRCTEHGHSWYAQINKRFSRNQGCRICNNQEVLAGFNDLATTHPQLAAEWHREKNGDRHPEHYTKGADVKVWWKCAECGYEWEAVLYSRTSKKPTGCPCCAENILVVGKNDLQTVNPTLAAQWDYKKNNPLTPRDVAANKNAKAWWLCDLKHSWEADISSRNRGNDCPYCSNHLLLRGFNDLQTRNPVLAKQWDKVRNHPLTASDVIATTHDYAWWKCEKGHSWSASVVNRNTLGTDCPKCMHKVVSPGETDLATVRPDIADAWDYAQNYPLTPDQVTSQSNRIVWWLCKKCGQSYPSGVSNRKSADHCPYCHGKRPIVGKTDFATVHPELLGEWDFEQNRLPPTAYTCGSGKRIWWRCSEGHSWQTAIVNRHYGSHCPVCEALRDKHVITVGVNDLASQNPEIATQWDASKNKELTAEQVMPGSNTKVWWQCKRGHSWLASVLSRTLGTKCPRCSGKTPMQTHFIS
jgi:DNA-directed RNA polymerase subunit RPC12/RpoP